MCTGGRGGDLVEAGRLRQAGDRGARVARARASATEGAGATTATGVAVGAALAAAAATAAAAADPACGDVVEQAACVRDSVGMQGVVQEGDGGGKDSGGDACEEANAATRGGGARGGDVPKTMIGFEGESESEEVGDGAGAQAGAVAAAARPVEAAGTVMGWEREVSYVGLEATPAKIAVDVSDAPRDAAGAGNRKRSNEQMRNSEEGIMLGESVDDVHSRQRRRTEKGSAVGIEQSVRVGQKRGRVEGDGEEVEGGGGRGVRVAAVRARVNAGANVRVVRMVRLAAVTTELQCMREYADNGMGRHRQVRWERGRWCIEEVYMGQEGRDRSGDVRAERCRENVSRGSTDEATIDSEEDEVRRRGAWELEAAAVESMGARRGYTAGAAWDEGAMIQAMARMDNPTLRWRYGDDVEVRGDTETQPETGDG